MKKKTAKKLTGKQPNRLTQPQQTDKLLTKYRKITIIIRKGNRVSYS